MEETWRNIPPPPTAEERLMNLIKQLSILADEYRIVFRGTVYTKEPQS